jgi:hypothetical protein
VPIDQEKAKVRERAIAGVESLSRRQRRRLKARPPVEGQEWATFASLAAYSDLSESSIDKLARAEEFESIKPFKDRGSGRLGNVPSFKEMMNRRRLEGPRFGEAAPIKPGSRPRGRPRKVSVEGHENGQG